MNDNMVTHDWFPSRLLNPQHPVLCNTNDDAPQAPTAPPPYALLILNQPINSPALTALLPSASLVVCADAGGDKFLAYHRDLERQANELNNITSNNNNHTTSDHERINEALNRLPDAIVGDLDSLSNKGRQYWSSKGTRIFYDPDQYSTDFSKALKWIRREWESHVTKTTSTRTTIAHDSATSINNDNDNDRNGIGNGNNDKLSDLDLDVVVMGGLGGRVDQAFSQIHHLFLALNDVSLLRGKIYLLSEQSLSFVLGQGLNRIWVDGWVSSGSAQEDDGGVNSEEERRGEDETKEFLERDPNETEQVNPCCFKESVGVIPVTGPATISMQGFEWDVTDWHTEFGGQLSTSNHIRSNRLLVEIKGSSKCMFTLELADHLQLSFHQKKWSG